MTEPEKRFKKGQSLTYKRRQDCPDGRYKHGGVTPKKLRQTLLYYKEFNHPRGCWSICVTHTNGQYFMLEDEFAEYDQVVQKEKSDYPIF